ncbi:MAG: electron transfer flavoprotein subunit beta [Deltaproteobacteria bacterium]|nr:MAG: electron transfer flavoprotein subunit beta [Deltaproteobacteria bacterium]
MKILVCVKEVAELVDQPGIRADRQWIENDDSVDYRINYYDEFAMEEAVLLREQLGSVTIDAVSVGPDRVETTLRRALALGADNAVHIRTSGEEGYLPAAAVARLIADFASKGGYDLILAGVMSEDCMERVTGPMIAALLKIPCATSVVEEKLEPGTGSILAVCELEGGVKETVRLSMPALLTVQSGINRPRYASLSNRLRAKSQPIEKINADTLGMADAGQSVHSVFVPEKTSGGIFIKGSPQEKAKTLVEILHEKTIL